jgi:hypothetical protein
MEFDRLSFHTRQPKYLQYATKAIQTVISKKHLDLAMNRWTILTELSHRNSVASSWFSWA